jgi:hypothetical protein
VALLLATLACLLAVEGGQSAAAVNDGRVGHWRFAETPDGSKAIPEGKGFQRGAARLTDKRVLVVNGWRYDGSSTAADVYDPEQGTWESLPDTKHGRRNPEVVQLPDDRAFVGGQGATGEPRPVELYDPAPDEGDNQVWIEATPGPLDKVMTATRLDDGTVLVTGTQAQQPAAAVFNPATPRGTWRVAEAPSRVYEATTRMPPSSDNGRDGGATKVLAVQGSAGSGKTKAEVYDPADQSWTDVTGKLSVSRKAPLLAGLDGGGALVVSNDTAFRYRPERQTWVDAGDPAINRLGHSGADATSLKSGAVLITGRDEAELFLPQGAGEDDGKFVLAGYAISRQDHTTTALAGGKALVVGGYKAGKAQGADLYVPPSAGVEQPPPAINERLKPAVDLGGTEHGGVEVTIEGSGFADAEQVTFGATPATEFSVVHHGRIVATAPPVEAPAKVTVQVETPQGTTGASHLATFNYLRPAGVWSPAGKNGTTLKLDEGPRQFVRAGVVTGGKVLVLADDEQRFSGAERLYLYDPRTGVLEKRGEVPFEGKHEGFVALSDGRALALKRGSGLRRPPHPTNRAAIYDPGKGEKGEWTQTSRGAPDVQYEDSAVLLKDGRVLVVADGEASLYDPGADEWRSADVDDPPGGTTHHAAVARLKDGRVLVAGGGSKGTPNGSHKDARVFDPDSEEWSTVQRMSTRRGLYRNAAARLQSGGVLVGGGTNPTGGGINASPVEERSAEVFDAKAEDDGGTWTGTGKLRRGRAFHTLTRLADGSVLAAGGLSGQNDADRLSSVEVYDAKEKRWEPTAPLGDARRGHAAIALSRECGSRCGNVLVVGGKRETPQDQGTGAPTRTLELYTPRPQVHAVESASGPLEGGYEVTITGQFFAGVDAVSFGGAQSDSFDVKSQTRIVAEVPPRGSNGPVPVTVTNDVPMGDGKSKELNSFGDEAPTFTYVSNADLVDDLRGEAASDSEVDLAWSAVDAGDASPAQAYVVAQSSQGPIDDAADFADAFTLCGGVCDQFDPPPQSIGDEVALSVTALEPGTKYHYAVAPVNVDGDRGPISDSVSVTTDGTPPDDGPSDGGGSSDEDGSDGEDTGDGSSDDGGDSSDGVDTSENGGGSSDGDDGTSDGGGGTSDGGGGTADGGSGSGGGGGQDTAEVGLTLQRLEGSNRMSTSVQASQEAFGNGQADAVVLARADEFADALAGVPFAHVVGGPLLLTHSDGLDQGVAGELQRVLGDGGAVWLLGGNGALSQQVEERIAEMGYEPKRLAGRNRFETAAIIAEFGLSAPDRALLATGGEFADAVTAGAAAAHTDAAVLLTAGDKLPPATAQYLQQQTPSVQHAVGGPAAAAAPQISALVGATRYETAATVADELFDQPATAGLATGTAFPDSLTGGAHIAGYGAPMLLSPPDGLHPAAADYLTAQAPNVTTTVLYGGPAALNQTVADGAKAAVATAGS